ncbi:carboxymuconolactone decarboxylase family protein [Leptospira sarikeiensis]|uniref:Carboxymuconolactone decarboxylase family protein n=1 Tax=Leptospira sarikeiensis TaxID=2484943 RepID=A0A4R9K9E1_9LEPT|nr:carboxymuconolactone decarboxylase family protein [Leptospira sarikeiensis]TGL62050.1 carboxymuconolactone decarboxylase family protein [Leptospira sarikeiensis]
MENRINVHEKGQAGMRALYSLAIYLEKTTIEKSLLHLLYFRVSQINGCANCLDMHSKDFRHEGGSEQRLYLLNAWREAPFYSEREKAALSLAEVLTQITKDHVSDDIYEEARKQFDEQELIDLVFAIITINSYNRVNIAFPVAPGFYQPGQYAAKSKG